MKRPVRLKPHSASDQAGDDIFRLFNVDDSVMRISHRMVPMGASIFRTVACVSIALAWLCSSASAFDSIDTDYHGPDAGTVIFSTSTLKISMNFAFYYERAGEGRDPDSTGGAGVIECSCVGFWHPKMSDPDYDTGYENGKVQIQHLPPGNYEVYTFGFGGTLIVANLSWSPSHGFSMPFTVKSGEATYIGNFARAPSLGTPLADTLGAAGYFVVSDKHDRDIAIARKKDPSLPSAITVSVTDVSQFGQPELLPQDPYPLPSAQ